MFLYLSASALSGVGVGTYTVLVVPLVVVVLSPITAVNALVSTGNPAIDVPVANAVFKAVTKLAC